MNKLLKKIPFNKIFQIFIGIIIIIQFFRIDKNNIKTFPVLDFLNATKAPEDITILIKKACYDCHSNETVYPWYTNIAPISWWIKNHVNEGSHHLNFSLWETYKSKRKDKKLSECIEMIEEDLIPYGLYGKKRGTICRNLILDMLKQLTAQQVVRQRGFGR